MRVRLQAGLQIVATAPPRIATTFATACGGADQGIFKISCRSCRSRTNPLLRRDKDQDRMFWGLGKKRKGADLQLLQPQPLKSRHSPWSDAVADRLQISATRAATTRRPSGPPAHRPRSAGAGENRNLTASDQNQPVQEDNVKFIPEPKQALDSAIKTWGQGR